VIRWILTALLLLALGVTLVTALRWLHEPVYLWRVI